MRVLLVTVSGALQGGCQREPPHPVFVTRPEIDRSHFSEFSILFDGTPIDEAHPHVHIGEVLDITGRSVIIPERLPKTWISRNLHLAFEPAGSPESVWEIRNPAHEWSIGGEADDFERRLELSPRKIDPGEYDLRVYFSIYDLEGDQHSCDLLAKGRLTVLPERVPPTDDARSPRR